MNRFVQMPGDDCITRSKGVFKQIPIFVRGNELFLKHGAGFIRVVKALHAELGISTSAPEVNIDDWPSDVEFTFSKTGTALLKK